MTPSAPATTSFEPTARRFCRGCGYDLRASQERCPDCGRAFDATNPRTFARRSPRARSRWLRRAAYLLVAVALLLAGTVAWLRQGWREDQRRAAELRARIAPVDLNVVLDSINPWLTDRLPARIGVYLRRVVKVEMYCEHVVERDFQNVGEFAFLRELSLEGEGITDAGLTHLRGLSRLERLELGGGGFTDAGIENLRGLRRLEYLTIQGGKMTNAGLEWLHELPRLKEFTICQNAVNREGLLRWLRRHPRVEVIDGPGGPLRLDEE